MTRKIFTTFYACGPALFLKDLKFLNERVHTCGDHRCKHKTQQRHNLDLASVLRYLCCGSHVLCGPQLVFRSELKKLKIKNYNNNASNNRPQERINTAKTVCTISTNWFERHCKGVKKTMQWDNSAVFVWQKAKRKKQKRRRENSAQKSLFRHRWRSIWKQNEWKDFNGTITSPWTFDRHWHAF